LKTKNVSESNPLVAPCLSFQRLARNVIVTVPRVGLFGSGAKNGRLASALVSV
jgi:hypothetical protein